MNVALRPHDLTFISLCSGGAGLDLGVELAIPNARPVVLVEGEAWSVATLVSAMEAGLLAPAPVWSDVRTFDGRPWRGIVDGLVGGIPCQPHSLAGKRKGEEDERDLWTPARRIIVQSRAWWVLIENVRGMVTSGGLRRVWRDLRRLGFKVECGLFTAEEVGATHQRERLFVLAVADADGRQQPWRSPEPRKAACGRSHGQSSGSGESLGHPDSTGLEGRRSRPDQRAGEWIAGPHGGELVNAPGVGCRERRPEPVVWSGRDSTAGAGATMADAAREGRWGVSIQPGRQNEAGTHLEWGNPELVRLFPPGPSDIDGWREVLNRSPELEPAVRRMADGVAARLDLAGPHAARIERLRMLGNGVVPLEAAYALRTLATRLAGRSAGAAALVRMMEADANTHHTG